MMRHRLALFALLVLLIAAGGTARAQVAAPTVRAVLADDGRAYVYHTGLFAIGSRVNVYRDGRLVTPTPLTTPTSGADLLTRLSPERYAQLRAALAEEERSQLQTDSLRALTPFEVLVLMRADPIASLTYTFLDPDLARVFGRLFIDESPPRGRATYRFAEVGALGTETGEAVEGEIRLERSRRRTPDRLRAEEDGGVVELTWRYPRLDRGDRRDFVIAFDVFEVSGPQPRRLNERALLRNAASDRHLFFYESEPSATSLQFVVRARDIIGQTSDRSDAVTVEIERDPLVLLPPAVVNAQVVENGTVVVRWTKPEGDVTGYRVLRARTIDAEAQRLHPSALRPGTTTFIDSTAGPGTHFYRVRALGADDASSAPSAAALVQIEDRTPPPAPTDLRGEAANETGGVVGVRLVWTAQSVPDLARYLITRQNLTTGGVRVPLGTGDTDVPIYIDRFPAPLPEGTRLRYSVAAQDSTRNTSEAIRVDFVVPNVQPPPMPEGVTVRAVDAGLRISWTPSTAPDLAGYRVERSTSGGSFDSVATVRAGARVWLDRAPTDPATLRYRVAALDAAGNASAPSAPVAAEQTDRTPPRIVRNVRARRGESGVRVTWEPAPSPDLTGYRILRASAATAPYEPVAEVGSVTTWTDPAAPAVAWYRVVAVDASGNASAPSEPTEARTR